MNREPNDVAIGLAVALSLMPSGMPARFYGRGLVVFGMSVLVLFNRRIEGARLIAIMLMPAVLLGKLLLKDMRSHLSRSEKRSGEK